MGLRGPGPDSDASWTGIAGVATAAMAAAMLVLYAVSALGAMGLLMTFAIAGALLVLSGSGVNATGAFALLWGSILATRTVDLVVLAMLAVVVHGLFWSKRQELGLVLFDRELALCSGVNADRLILVLLVATAVAIGGGIRLTGALLVDALTLLPALGARNLGRSLRSMVIWSIILGYSERTRLRCRAGPGPTSRSRSGAGSRGHHPTHLPDPRKGP
jgi:zinc transport system permease protein